MAKFNILPPDINDPNYLSYSHTPGRPQSVEGDKSMGELFKGLGEVIGTGSKGIDTAIQANLRETIEAKVDPIRNAHGADLLASEAPAVAGTGARGARYESVAGTGLTDDLDMDAVPGTVKARMSGLARYKEAYLAGELSNTHYYAELNAVSKEMKSQYPAYSEQIDHMLHSITGVIPANALRSSVLNDMNSMAAAAGKARNEDRQYFEKHFDEIQLVRPGTTLDEFIANRKTFEPYVGRLRSLKTADEYEKYGADRSERNAERLATNSANRIVATSLMSAYNASGTSAARLREQIMSAVNKAPDAAAIDEMIASVTKLELATRQAIQDDFRKPGFGGANSPDSYASFLTKSGKDKTIEEQAMKPILDLKQALINKDYGVAFRIANQLKIQNSHDDALLEKIDPRTRVIGSMRRIWGDQAANTAIMNSGILGELNNQYFERFFGQVTDTQNPNPPKSVYEFLQIRKEKDGTAPAELVRGAPKALISVIQGQDNAKAERAVQSLYSDPRFFAGLNARDRERMLQELAAESTTKRIAQLKPESQEQYRKFVERAWSSVFQQAGNDFQTAVTDKKYNWEFDDKKFQFRVTDLNPLNVNPGSKVGGLSAAQPAEIANTNRFTTRLNEGLKVLAPVLKQFYPGNEIQGMVNLMKEVGVDLNAPQRGSIADQLIEAAKKKVKPDDPNMGIKIDNIPDGMSPAQYLKELQKQKRSEGEGEAGVKLASDPGLDPQKWREEPTIKELLQHLDNFEASQPMDKQRARGMQKLKFEMLKSLGVDVNDIEMIMRRNFNDTRTYQDETRDVQERGKYDARQLKKLEKELEQTNDGSDTNGAWMPKHRKKEVKV